MAESKTTILVEAIDRATNTLKGIANQTKSLSKLNSLAMADMGRVFSEIGGKITATTDKMIGAFAGFDQAMANTMSIAAGTSKQFNEMRANALEMSVEMGKSATEIANGYYFLASAGFDANKIMEVTPQILKLAAGTAADFSSTANLVTATLDVYGEQVGDVNIATDMLMNTVKSFKTTLPELAISLGYSMTAARDLGVDFGDLLAATGLLRQANMDASKSGTAMRRMLTSLLTPSAKVQAWMEEHSFTLKRNEDGTLDFAETVRDLSRSLEEMSDPIERAIILNEFFGDRGQAAASILSDNVDKLEQFSAKMTEAGSTQDAFNKQTEGAGFKLSVLEARTEAVSIALGESLFPAEVAMTEATLALSESISALPPELVAVGGGFLLVAGNIMSAVGPMLMFIAHSGPLVSGLRLSIGYLRSAAIMLTTYQTAAIGAAAAIGGVALAFMAMQAKDPGQRAMLSALTGLTWGLAAANFALMLAKMGMVSFGVGTAVGIGLMVGALAAVGVAVASAQAQGAQHGAFIRSGAGGAMVEVGEGKSDEWIVNQPQMKRLLEEAGGGGDIHNNEFNIILPPFARIDEITLEEIGEMLGEIYEKEIRKRGG